MGTGSDRHEPAAQTRERSIARSPAISAIPPTVAVTRLPRRPVEVSPSRLKKKPPRLIAGLIPFTALGLRVFGACFIGVPTDDPVRIAVAPVVDWVNGGSGVIPFQWVIDSTLAIGLAWLVSIGTIPWRWMLATIWVMPAVALASLMSLRQSRS